ncbi:hypothetical protein SLW70_11670 [Flavobacterium sp. NG2]|uniref:hypothetical protein n=1 Tax=Flavobacterium sp. NG2 TaxID=3097547 RepID=UPI002A81E747|nr:hypothetical protein [Flavobacterium sp. NG2]WPR70590.1 hypothetical protein SLW70_11670 [Flavobacterium sp. NG2]
MKKITMIFGVLSVLTIVSCRDKKEHSPPPPPQVESTSEEPNEEANGTSISIGSDGVNIQTKDEKKETNVSVEDGEAKLEIKK